MTILHRSFSNAPHLRLAAAFAVVLAVAACAHHHHGGTHHAQQMLSGANEVPPNASTATGVGTLQITADGSVSGTVTVSGMAATAAHIHLAPAGQNGPVIVPLVKTGDNAFAPAAGAKLTDTQYASYLAGNLYVNVHSAAIPGGEVRAQLAAPK
jgi:hypothetical protein